MLDKEGGSSSLLPIKKVFHKLNIIPIQLHKIIQTYRHLCCTDIYEEIFTYENYNEYFRTFLFKTKYNIYLLNQKKKTLTAVPTFFIVCNYMHL